MIYGFAMDLSIFYYPIASLQLGPMFVLASKLNDHILIHHTMCIWFFNYFLQVMDGTRIGKNGKK